jgi:tetratricopeptide (TPR) repeat protein
VATVDSIMCGLFWACELVNDVPRADQWMRAAADLLPRRNVVAAFCRAHYGGILTAAGRWNEAERELLQAARHFDRGMPQRRAAAMIRLADLRVRQGRLEEAALLLDGLDRHPDAVRALAALHLARGEVAVARDLLERATAAPDDEVPTVGESTMVGPLLALRPAGAVSEGRGRAGQGRLCVASGQGDDRACLHKALEGFSRAELPMELARTRLEMARALSGRAPEVAVAEARAALEDFERLEAARHADAAGALLRSLGAPVRTGPKGVGALTRREAEVLELVGAGLSNPRDRRAAVHHPQDRRAPRRQPAGQARPAQPGRGGRLGHPAETRLLDRGPPRYFPGPAPASCSHRTEQE